jgi:D-lactate dehydrogenase (cytochrome)
MISHRIQARPPHGHVRPALVETDADTVGRFLEDAAHYPDGHAAGVACPESEAEVAAVLRGGVPVLPVGSQSSLTGGATPMGAVVVSTARLNRVVDVARDRVRAQAGVTLDVLNGALAPHGTWYPPVPTCTAACCGGVVATNAAGPATFKYGVTRRWVRALTVVLASGDVIDIERGAVAAHPDGFFEIAGAGAELRVPIPALEWPAVPKCSAGYFCTPGMDLVDLFIGSEGTLGIVTEVVLDVVPRPPAICLALVPLPSESAAIDLTARLRRESHETRRRRDPNGLDISSIEHVDRRSLELLREDGADRRIGVALPGACEVVLFVEVELVEPLSLEAAWHQMERALESDAPPGRLGRLCRLLDAAGVLDTTQVVLPGETARAGRHRLLREEVPSAVNRRVAAARVGDTTITKTAADVIVPFDRFGEMMGACRRAFDRRGLDVAVWGHISDGHVHPNVIPRSREDVGLGREAVLELGGEVVRLGGSPLAEHGVGRNPIKQRLLRLLHGERGVEAMRAVKRALDPRGLLAPGVLFPAP